MQHSLIEIDQFDPAEIEPEDKRIARVNAADAWNTAYLARFNQRRAAAILSSGDATRIRLYNDWLKHQGMERAA